MIIDCHAHVFQNWHGACGHPSIDVHLKYIQKNVTRPAAETFRVRDGKRVKPGLLFRSGDPQTGAPLRCARPQRRCVPQRCALQHVWQLCVPYRALRKAALSGTRRSGACGCVFA